MSGEIKYIEPKEMKDIPPLIAEELERIHKVLEKFPECKDAAPWALQRISDIYRVIFVSPLIVYPENKLDAEYIKDMLK